MNKIKDVLTQSPTAKQHAIADFLLSICPSEGFLLKHADKLRYITLDEQAGKSKNNKNAVSILRGLTSFMVPDWSLVPRAEQIGLDCKPIDKLGKRLEFPKLTIPIINEIPGALVFFKELLVVAKKESHYRQLNKRSKNKAHVVQVDQPMPDKGAAR